MKRHLLTALATTGFGLAFGMAGPSPAHAGDEPPTPILLVEADGCDFTFTTINGQGVNDGWTASFTVDGQDAGTWSSSDDSVVLTNWISRVFQPGGTLVVTWSVHSLPGQAELDSGTTTITVPPCEPPYQLRLDKVVAGTAPAAGYTVAVWFGGGDGGDGCAAQPPQDAQFVQLPAAGGSATVRVTPGPWCVAETERQGATSTTYGSTGGVASGAWHMADVAYQLDPGAPVTRVVTITNTFPGSTPPRPQLPSTGTSTASWLAAAAALMVGAGLTLRRIAATR